MRTRTIQKSMALAMLLSLACGVQAADLPKITHDCPMYIGPNGTFADQSKVPLLDDFSQARLVWKSEDKSIGWGKSTSGEHVLTKRAPGLYASGQGSLIVAGGLVIAGYFIPSGEKIYSVAANEPPEFRQRALISADDVILAVDAATGKTRWKQVFAGKGINRLHSKHPTYGLTPVAAGGKVFHLGSTERIYCVDLATGKPLWESEGPNHKPLEEMKNKALNAPTFVVRGGFYFAIRSLVECDRVLLVSSREPLEGLEEILAAGLKRDTYVPARETLNGYDCATGKKLWTLENVLSECNVPCPVQVEGRPMLFCVNGQGEMRLIEPKTGKVLWMKAMSPAINHFTQPVAVDGKAFLYNSGVLETDKKGRPQRRGKPACYELTLDGARLLWELPDKYSYVAAGDGAASPKIACRDGIAYFGVDTGKSEIVAVNIADGKLLHSLAPANWGQFHLWGDKLVVIGDNSHESMGTACSYTPYTLKLIPSGSAYSPRGNQGVSGYILPIRDPFADGFQFTRTATGQIWCYDLRKPSTP